MHTHTHSLSLSYTHARTHTHTHTTHTCRWLERADFYDDEWFPGIQYFDSWEELVGTKIPEWHLMLRI